MLTIGEIKQLIEKDRTSKSKADARKAQDYYDSIHDIKDYRIFYHNADGDLVEDKERANVKIAHPFFTELVDQEVQYILSGDRLMECENVDLQKEIDAFFDEEFKSELAESLTDVCALGWGYMYAYINHEGRLAFSAANTLGVIEVRAKDTQDKTDHVIYCYKDTIVNKEITRIEVWDKTDVYYYVQDGEGVIVEDEDATINPRPHILWSDTSGSEWHGQGFGFIPFFRMDNNRKRASNLVPIKDIIDDYDLNSCALSNNLQDFDSPVWAVKGFEGESMQELIESIKAKKMVGLTESGDIDIKTVSIPFQARVAKLELDEANIYHFGMGFNPSQVGDGNITNVVIKSRYALLDLKCNKLEMRLRRFLRELIKVVISEINDVTGTAYQESDVKITLERQVMANELDNAQIEQVKATTENTRITTILNSSQAIGREKTVRQVCAILDIDPEEILNVAPEAPAEGSVEEEKQVLQGSKSMYPITSVLDKYSRKKLTRNNAIRMLEMLGVSEEEAVAMLDDRDDEDEQL